jgi:hypothetical protein
LSVSHLSVAFRCYLSSSIMLLDVVSKVFSVALLLMLVLLMVAEAQLSPSPVITRPTNSPRHFADRDRNTLQVLQLPCFLPCLSRNLQTLVVRLAQIIEVPPRTQLLRLHHSNYLHPTSPPSNGPSSPPTPPPTLPPTSPPTHGPTSPPTLQPTSPPTHGPTFPPTPPHTLQPSPVPPSFYTNSCSTAVSIVPVTYVVSLSCSLLQRSTAFVALVIPTINQLVLIPGATK